MSWVGFVFGSVMSVGANVLHTWLPSDRMPPSWTLGIAAQVAAAVVSSGLLLSVEVLRRVPWRRGWQWSLAWVRRDRHGRGRLGGDQRLRFDPTG